MILRARHATAAALAAAAVLTVGCGATIYDAQGVPRLTCTSEVPLACGFTCLPASKEADAQCGAQCLDCSNGGANALSSDAAATNFCNVNDPDVALHACDFRCDGTPGFVKNPVTNRCDCADGSQVRCGGASACAAQTVSSCGDGCVDCTNPAVFSAPAHGSAKCDAAARGCAFDCAPTFQKSTAGDACVCPAGQVACGGGAARSSCIAQAPAVCGAGCVNCQDAAQFPVNPAFAAGVTCGGDGNGAAGNTPCDLGCPAATPNKFFNTTTNQWDCSASPVCDPATQHTCPSDQTCWPNTDPNHCGTSAGCNVCGVPAGAPPGTAATCVANACDFNCPSGFFKNGGTCVRVQTTEGGVAAGGNHTCAILTTDPGAGAVQVVGLRCWGANASGQLGTGNRVEAHKAQAVTLAGAPAPLPIFVAAGVAHTCAIANGVDKQVQCWGANASGQLGVDQVDQLSPRVVPGVSGARALAAGSRHTCAIVNGGSGTGEVVCWGANDVGQLGNPAAGASSTVPVQVKTGAGATQILTSVSQLSSSGDTTCALASGAVFCWGANARAQAAQAATNAAVAFASPLATAIPVARPGGAPVRVAAGGLHACAATTGDTFCWGDDTVQQLGDKKVGTFTATPVDATALTNVADLVAAGRLHTCNVRSAAAGDVAPVLTCAGANDKLQSGSGVVVANINKVDIALPGAAGVGVTLLVSGGDHTCTVTAAGALLCFGSNANGQLGDGTTANNATPSSPAPQ